MKKIFILLVAVLSIGVLNAQTPKHFSFQGIQIDGSITEFVKKMEVKGFKTDTIQGNFAIMEGTFAGIPGCMIMITATRHTDKVYFVGILTPEYDIWDSLKHDYAKFKKLYIAKYKAPFKSDESFTDPYFDGCGYELSVLEMGKYNYFAEWILNNGRICLTIGTTGRISFTYTDKINFALDEKEEESDILEDI